MVRTRIWLATPLAVLVACGASPVRPTPAPTGPPKLAVVGQSNARMIVPAFTRHPELLTVVPARSNGPVISCWDEGDSCWTTLLDDFAARPKLDAFVFWQGEGDITNPQYGAKLASLIQRVRTLVGQPDLLIVLMQYGPAYSGRAGGSEEATVAFSQQDAHAIYVPTHDLEWLPDGGHMTEAGYDAVTQRIVAAVHAKSGR
jgi:hypothetical protein